MAEELSQLPFEKEVALTDEVWRIQTQTQVVSLDFSLFSKNHTRFAESVTVSYDKQTFELDLPDVAKLLWLHGVKAKNANYRTLQGVFNFIALVFSYVSSQKATY